MDHFFVLAQFNWLSPTHMIVILVVALLLFGNRLPEVARSIGRAINEFKKGMKEVGDDMSGDAPPADKPRLSGTDTHQSTTEPRKENVQEPTRPRDESH